MFQKTSYSKIYSKTCVVETTIIQVYSLQPGTLLKTDSITAIFLQIFRNYPQPLYYPTDNCDHLLVKLPLLLCVNGSPM